MPWQPHALANSACFLTKSFIDLVWPIFLIDTFEILVKTVTRRIFIFLLVFFASLTIDLIVSHLHLRVL